MIARIVDGGNMVGLMLYLTGPGRANEHTSPHLVTGDGALTERWGGWEELSAAQAVEMAHTIDRYMTVFNVKPMGNVRTFDKEAGKQVVIDRAPNHVWHCSLSLHPDDGPLSEETWRAIAEDFMRKMGFTGDDGKAPCRWVAIHHGPAKNGGDHIHIAANTVRADGTKWVRGRDQIHAQRAVNTIEHKYGLRVIESREHGRGARADTAADLRAAVSKGQARTDRDILLHRMRAAAVASTSEVDFLVRLRELGVRARPRFAKGRTDVVTGYSVALHTRDGERARWYSGGDVARDLSLPRLRSRWPDTPHSAQQAVDAWRQAWRGMPPQQVASRAELAARSQALDAYSRGLHGIDATDPVALADATRDVAGLLSAHALIADDARAGELLARAARTAGRAAQTHRRPAPAAAAPEAISLAAALALSAVAGGRADATVLAVQALALVDALADLYRAAQQVRTAQEMLDHAHAALAAINRPPAVTGAQSRSATRVGAAGPVRIGAMPAPAPGPGPSAGTSRPARVPAGMGADQVALIQAVAAAATPPGPSGAPPTAEPDTAGRPTPGLTQQEAERVRHIMDLALTPPARGGRTRSHGEPPLPPAPTRGRSRSL